jgi:hypothetical protein
MATSNKVRSAAASVASIEVSKLRLDPENPRLPPRDDEAEWDQPSMLHHFSRDSGIRELASDIASHGVNPTKRVMVVPGKVKGTFVVKEGNRRLAAIKLLRQPGLAEHQKDTTALQRLAKGKSLPKKLTCVIGLSDEQVRHWMEIEHTKDHKGRGTVSWGSQEHTRFTMQSGKARHHRSMFVLEGLVDRRLIDLPTMKAVPLTTLDRILQDKYVRSHVDTSDPDLFKKHPVVLQRVVLDLADGMTVNAVRGAEDRRQYIDKVIADPTKSNAPKSARPRAAAAARSSTKTRSARQATDRKYLIPSAFAVTTKHSRLKEIARELRELKVEGFENAVAMLFRALLEISVRAYIKANKLRIASRPTELKGPLLAVCTDLEHKGLCTSKELHAIKVAQSDKTHFLAIEGFHNYVHDDFGFPNKRTLIRTWESYVPLMSQLL